MRILPGELSCPAVQARDPFTFAPATSQFHLQDIQCQVRLTLLDMLSALAASLRVPLVCSGALQLSLAYWYLVASFL